MIKIRKDAEINQGYWMCVDDWFFPNRKNIFHDQIKKITHYPCNLEALRKNSKETIRTENGKCLVCEEEVPGYIYAIAMAEKMEKIA